MSKIKLIIGNSESKIENLPKEHHKPLKELLSYIPASQTYGSSYRFTPKRCLIDKAGIFPSGLQYIIESYFKMVGLKYQIQSLRRLPEAISDYPINLPCTPYTEQEEAANACLNATRGIVVAPTGMGKSIIAALIISKVKVKTLLVVPTVELREQLTKSLSQYFSTTKCGRICDNPDIAVENVDALDPNKILTDYHCVIIDEFHHSGAKSYRKLNKKAWKNVYFKFGLTATPFRSQDRERLLLEGVLSKVIYSVDYYKAVSKGYIVPIEAYYYEVPQSDTSGLKNNWHSVYSALVTNNGGRNALIGDILRGLKEAKIPTLCLVKEITHGEALRNNGEFYFANGENSDTPHLIKLFNSEKLTTLIGTNGVIGEGIDTKPAEFIIIAGLGKSKNAFMQQVGRGLRVHKEKTSCKIILFKDNSHKWTKRHFAEQVKILREQYGISPEKLTFENSVDKSTKA